MTINVPAGVTASPASLLFSGCDVREDGNVQRGSRHLQHPRRVGGGPRGGQYTGQPTAFRLDVGGAPAPEGPVNSAPQVGEIAGARGTGGSTGTYSVAASDADGDALTYAWSVVQGNASVSSGGANAAASVFFPDGPSAVQLQVVVDDGRGQSATRTLDVAETNVAPSVSAASLTRAGACAVGLSASFRDPAVLDTHTATIAWGDGSSSAVAPATAPSPAPTPTRRRARTRPA